MDFDKNKTRLCPYLKSKGINVNEDRELAAAAGLPQQLLNMTIRELVKKYRSVVGVERYVKILGDLMAADEKDQRITEQRLINRLLENRLRDNSDPEAPSPARKEAPVPFGNLPPCQGGIFQ